MEAVSFNLDIGFNKNPFAKDVKGSASTSELTVLIGLNGVGKSTLLRTIAGQQKKITGSAYINGENLDSFSLKEKSEVLSFVSTEKIKPNNMSVFAYVAMGRYIYTNWLGSLSEKDESIIINALEISGIVHLKDRFLNELSDGEFQKVIIARAISQDTPIIILDEPTSFLDISGKYDIICLLKNIAIKENKCIILSTHDLNIALELADKIWVMDRGEIKEGTPNDLIEDNTVNNLFSKSGLNSKNFEFKMIKN